MDVLFAGVKDVVKHWTFGTLPDRSLPCVRQSFYASFIQPILHLDSNYKFTPSYHVPPMTCNSLPSTIHCLPTSLLPSYDPLLLSTLHSLCHSLTSLLPFSPPLSLKYVNSNSFKVTLEPIKVYQRKRKSKRSTTSTGIDVETAAADEAIRLSRSNDQK